MSQADWITSALVAVRRAGLIGREVRLAQWQIFEVAKGNVQAEPRDGHDVRCELEAIAAAVGKASELPGKMAPHLAARWLKSVGAPGLASRLAKLGKGRNALSHPDVDLVGDISRFLEKRDCCSDAAEATSTSGLSNAEPLDSSSCCERGDAAAQHPVLPYVGDRQGAVADPSKSDIGAVCEDVAGSCSKRNASGAEQIDIAGCSEGASVVQDASGVSIAVDLVPDALIREEDEFLSDAALEARAALDQARELLESMKVAEAFVDSDSNKGFGGDSHKNAAAFVSGKAPLGVMAVVEDSVAVSADLLEKNDSSKLKPFGDEDVKPVLVGTDTVAADQLVDMWERRGKRRWDPR